jgi:GNAT superfamily N-acetyltransferase
MDASPISTRRPRLSEAEALTALVLRSKAHWGYDADFMAAAAEVLEIAEEDLARPGYTVAVDEDDTPLGLLYVTRHGAAASLDKLFVDPPAMGLGVGRLLFDLAVEQARVLGAKRMTIESDPQAAPFYERMGAEIVGEAPSEAIPGRMLPLLELAL